MRIKYVSWALAVIFVSLSLGLLNLGLIHSGNYRRLSDQNSIRLLPQLGARGKILDRNGEIIIDNKLSYDVMVSPGGKSGSDKIFLEVARILGIDLKDIKELFKSSYVASSLPVTIARNIDIKKAIALEELKLDTPGIVIQANPVRHYPYGKLAAHVAGYVGEIDRWRLTKLADYGYKTKDLVGFGGVEEKYDYYLRQEEGGLSVEVDHRGRFIRILGFRPPQNGKDIELTLDLKIQKITEASLGDKKGAVVIMDPYTGEIIAMASSPSFNPAVFADKINTSIAGLVNNPASPLINRAVSSAFPAGSVFKLVVSTAALENKKINLNTSFVCTGKTLVGRKEFACWNTHGTQSIIPAIAHSCNVFFYKTGLLTGAQLIYDYAVKLGFSRQTGFELPYEISGFIPSPLWRKVYRLQNWFDGDTANLSIGQGDVLVTPLQIARMMSFFANQNYLVTPYIVKAVAGRDISKYQRRLIPLTIKASTMEYIRKGLRQVVADPEGTANVLSGLSVPVAGKSGSAQAAHGAAHGWFTAFFPYPNAKFVICVFLERAGAGYYASVLTKQIIEGMIKEGLI